MVCSQCATAVSVQIEKEIYAGEVVVEEEVSVSIVQVFSKCVGVNIYWYMILSRLEKQV